MHWLIFGRWSFGETMLRRGRLWGHAAAQGRVLSRRPAARAGCEPNCGGRHIGEGSGLTACQLPPFINLHVFLFLDLLPII